MKRFLFAIFLVISSTSFAQDLAGTIVVEPMIGFPNAGVTYLVYSNIFDNNESFDITGSPVQIGGRFEYIATDNIGLGFEANYEKCGYNMTIPNAIYNPITGACTDSSVVWSQTKLRLMGRVMFHFGNFDRVDLYTGTGIGYTQERQENPDSELDPMNTRFVCLPKLIDNVTSPLSARIYFGSRFLFSDNIGMTTEVGLGGGSIFQVGVIARFRP